MCSSKSFFRLLILNMMQYWYEISFYFPFALLYGLHG